ncbi:uncharacterized protein EDB91DRAFT_1252743 [Suillus paluster]|uniref:uncharacterized protein n=1 Tax=Suillus paluster TaxID=48578 RepID=UPI001B8631AA|nr:uncharacterized protein EDB91DRAFT_1252743 [Suillus paluster]KAG1730268.1 hypothetical protein EDB91DRAFT_1252743 [Suillus paluster]
MMYSLCTTMISDDDTPVAITVATPEFSSHKNIQQTLQPIAITNSRNAGKCNLVDADWTPSLTEDLVELSSEGDKAMGHKGQHLCRAHDPSFMDYACSSASLMDDTDIKECKMVLAIANVQQTSLDSHLQENSSSKVVVPYMDIVFHEAAIEWLISTSQPVIYLIRPLRYQYPLHFLTTSTPSILHSVQSLSASAPTLPLDRPTGPLP